MPAVACQYVLVLAGRHNVSHRTGVETLGLEDLVVDLLILIACSSPRIAHQGFLELWITCLSLLPSLDQLPVSWYVVLICRLTRCPLYVLCRRCIEDTAAAAPGEQLLVPNRALL